MGARVVGIGQRLAGDDGVGLRVAERVRALDLPGVEVASAASATDLIAALEGPERVIVVDAVLGPGEPGRLHVAAPEDFGAGRLVAVSTHGLDVPGAVAMARALYPETVAPSIRIVGVEIARADRLGEGLSAEVAMAVEGAARAVIDLLCEGADGGTECTSHPSPGRS
jgi:hydrogenase maturation protease